MYSIEKDINRLEICVINSFNRSQNNILIDFAQIQLKNFIEEGFDDKITSKAKLSLYNIFNEAFYDNISQSKIEKPIAFEQNFFITGFLKNEDNDGIGEFEIISWNKDHPYNKEIDNDFTIWKFKAKSFKLFWDQFIYH